MRFLPESDPRRQVWERCESPIEQMLCTALFADLGFNAIEGDFSDQRLPELLSAEPTAFLFAQQWMAGYRVDFLIVVADQEGCILFAIECDGRDFHSSEEQRAYDKQRDAALRLAGCREVLRLAGSTIFRHARIAANLVHALIGIEPKAPEDCEWYRDFRDYFAEQATSLRYRSEERPSRSEEELAAIRRDDATWM